jgi:MFS family permease
VSNETEWGGVEIETQEYRELGLIPYLFGAVMGILVGLVLGQYFQWNLAFTLLGILGAGIVFSALALLFLRWRRSDTAESLEEEEPEEEDRLEEDRSE